MYTLQTVFSYIDIIGGKYIFRVRTNKTPPKNWTGFFTCFFFFGRVFLGWGFLMPALINLPRALSSACPCTGRPVVLPSGC